MVKLTLLNLVASCFNSSLILFNGYRAAAKVLVDSRVQRSAECFASAL